MCFFNRRLLKGEFQEVIDDELITDKSKVERVVFTTGKLYYDLLKESDNAKDADKIAIVRLEQIYPFAEKQFNQLLKLIKTLQKLFGLKKNHQIWVLGLLFVIELSSLLQEKVASNISVV